MATLYLPSLCLVSVNAHHNIITIFQQSCSTCGKTNNSVSFVVFCGIIIYHVWDHLSKSCLKQPITKIMRLFKKPPPTPITGDAEVPLIHPGSLALVCETSLITVVSVVMRRESLLGDEDD